MAFHGPEFEHGFPGCQEHRVLAASPQKPHAGVGLSDVGLEHQREPAGLWNAIGAG